MSGDGWSFWANDGGRIRQFMVGENDLEKAKLVVQSSYPSINFLDFVTKQRIPGTLVQFLELTPGKTMEWEPSEPKDGPLTPRGADISSDLIK